MDRNRFPDFFRWSRLRSGEELPGDEELIRWLRVWGRFTQHGDDQLGDLLRRVAPHFGRDALDIRDEERRAVRRGAWRMRNRRLLVPIAAATAIALALGAARRRPDRVGRPHLRTSWRHRNADVVKLGATVGADYAATAARKLFASAERRTELDRSRELRTAEAVAERLGNMKGALMKLGQMASYLDEALPAPLREIGRAHV